MPDLLASLRLFALSQLVCCVVYPAAVWIFARVVVPEKQTGSLIRNAGGDVIGSRLLGQNFARPEYFWPRPSAAGADGYAADAASGSNLSPANPAIRGRAEPIVARLGGSAKRLVPADLVTASGSGLDPHVSLAAAQFQVPRVAAARGMSEDEVRRVVDETADGLPLDGGAVVNVLELNIALDVLQAGR